MFKLRVIPNDPKRKRCQCPERCALLVQYVDMDGDVVRTVCANEAKEHAINILNALISASGNVLKDHKSLKSYRSWKADEKKLIEMYNAGLSYGMIAIRIGRTYKATERKIAELRLKGKLRPRSPKTPVDVV